MATIFANQSSFPNTQIEKETCSYIEELIQKDNKITPNKIYNLLSEKFINLNPNHNDNADKYPFTFSFVCWLDDKYFGLGGGYWLNAYSRPEECDIIKKDEFEYMAINCGIFTFNMCYFEKANKSYINEIDKFIDTKLISNPEIKPHEMYNIIMEHFINSEHIDNLDLYDAIYIDNVNYGTGGCLWRESYGFPNLNDEIEICDIKYIAKNVGIYTFDLVRCVF